MSTEDQARAYLGEAQLTLDSEMAIYDAASPDNELWAQVVKNSSDALEQAASAL